MGKYVDSIDHDEDPMYDWEVQFGSCEHTNGYGEFFLMIIAITKILLFVWGLYLALTVIKVPRKALNDSFEIIIAVILASALFICVTPLQLFIQTNSLIGVNVRYGLMVFAILIASNVGIGSLVLPRFVAIYRNVEHKYTDSDEKKLRKFKEDCEKKIRERYEKQMQENKVEEDDEPGHVSHHFSRKSIRSQSSGKEIIELTEDAGVDSNMKMVSEKVAGSSKTKNGYTSVRQEDTIEK